MEPGAHVDAVVARERLGTAMGAALFAAGVLLVVAVLPAEFGIDPSGIGRRLGLTAMNDTDRGLKAFEASRARDLGGAVTVVPQERPYQHETVEFAIAPGDSVEYKYRLD